MTGSPPDAGLQAIAAQLLSNGRLLRSWPLEGGQSAELRAMAAAGRSGRPITVVIRHYAGDQEQNGRRLEREYRLQKLLHAAGVAVPLPLLLDLSCQHVPYPYLVSEYVDGRMWFDPPDTGIYGEQMALHLATVHQLVAATTAGIPLPRADGVCQERMTLPLSGAAGEQDTDMIHETLRRTGVPPQTNADVLLHGDYWPGNTLWRDGELAAVIDWEDALVGDPLLDLARSRSEIAWIFGMEAMARFSDAYLRHAPQDTTNLPYWDLCAALRQIRLANGSYAASAAYFHQHGRTDITAGLFQARLAHFIRQALEALGPR